TARDWQNAVAVVDVEIHPEQGARRDQPARADGAFLEDARDCPRLAGRRAACRIAAAFTARVLVRLARNRSRDDQFPSSVSSGFAGSAAAPSRSGFMI